MADEPNTTPDWKQRTTRYCQSCQNIIVHKKTAIHEHYSLTKKYIFKPKNAIELLTLIFVCAYTVVSCQQKNISIKQLEDAHADHRPWIPTPEIFVTGPILFKNRPYPWVPFGIQFKNIGHSPASNVTIKFKIQIITQNNTDSAIFHSVGDEERLCADAAKEAELDQFRGKFLFPNDHETAGQAGGGVEPKDIPIAWPNPHDILFRIIGCIDYTFADTPDVHGQTGFSYTLSSPIGGGVERKGFDPDNGDVPPDHMVFDRDFFHAGYIR